MSVLLVEEHGPVRRFTLNRPEKRNALNGELLDAMLAAFSETPGAHERVAVIQGRTWWHERRSHSADPKPGGCLRQHVS